MAGQKLPFPAPPVGLRELFATHPTIEGFPIAPARDDEYLISAFGTEHLHRDETGKILNIPAAIGEPPDDLVSRPVLDRQPVHYCDHNSSRLPGDDYAAAADTLRHLERLERLGQ